MGSEKRKNRKLRNELKECRCSACGHDGTEFNPIDACHIRTFKVTQSDHPDGLLPMCRNCHSLQHRIGWARFFEKYPHVLKLIQSKGWSVWPKTGGGVILSHPEIK